MDSNLPTPPKAVEELRTELKRSEQTGTLFISVWTLARLSLATLEWADTLAKQVADTTALALNLRQQMVEAQEVAQDLVMKAEQWQKQLEWHYEDFPQDGEEVVVVLGFLDAIHMYEARRGLFFSGKPGWWIDGYGWLEDFPMTIVKCWQRINLPLELQVQDKNE